MTKSATPLIPVRRGDLVVGKPLQKSIYDAQGKLLLAIGCLVESSNQLNSLAQQGFTKDYDSEWDDIAPKRPNKSLLIKNSAKHADAPGSFANGKEVVVGLDDVRWHIGETLYLQQVDNPNIRHTVQLIGFVRNKSVFVTLPMTDGKLEFIREGQSFVVRAFSGKKAYAFVTTAMKSVHTPHPYLHLAYPKELRCTLVRRGARVPVRISASILLGQSERMTAVTLNDLSVGGFSCASQQTLGVKGEGGRIQFTVHAADLEQCLNLKMVLRSVAPAENGEGFMQGCEFLDMSTHDRLILSAFVHQTLAEGQVSKTG